ncbi:hypothetical protein TrST_g3783 [Triparma strigata]|uniref:Uncharacterized protein n=1 Tax=Triparma strigata TaxID=1606541 RepID=A0A9W7AFG7_9STRA|nr:hypothetical protein TrST_g3783 [Triparma strigata]
MPMPRCSIDAASAKTFAYSGPPAGMKAPPPPSAGPNIPPSGLTAPLPPSRGRGFSRFEDDLAKTNYDDDGAFEVMDEEAPQPLNSRASVGVFESPGSSKSSDSAPFSKKNPPGPPPGEPISFVQKKDKSHSGRPNSTERPKSDGSSKSAKSSKSGGASFAPPPGAPVEFISKKSEQKFQKDPSKSGRSSPTPKTKSKRMSRGGSNSPTRDRNVTFTSNTSIDLPKTHRGTGYPRKAASSTASNATVGTVRKTELSSAPSVNDYTESEITKERIWEGKAHQFCGFFLLFFAAVSFCVSMFASTMGKIDEKVESMIRYRTTTFFEDDRLFDAFQWNQDPYLQTTNNFYFFDCTNKDEVLNGGTPVLEEKGPYVFQQTMARLGITFSADLSELTYTRAYKQEFVDDEEWLWKLDDQITMPSVAYVSAMNSAEGYGFSGEDYLVLQETYVKLEKIADFFSESNDGNKVSDIPEKYYFADLLWKKFVPLIIYDIYDQMRNNWAADDCGIDWWYWREEQDQGGGANVDSKGFLKKWGGECGGGNGGVFDILEFEGCLSSTGSFCSNCCSKGISMELLDLMDPKICPGYSEWQDNQCKRNMDNKVYIDQVLELFDASNKMSFMADVVEVDENGDFAFFGTSTWVDEMNAGMGLVESHFAGIVSADIYNDIRNWLFKVSNSSSKFHNAVMNKIQSWTGQAPSDSVKKYLNSAALQFGTGRVIGGFSGSGQVRSFYDSQSFLEDRQANNDLEIKWDHSRWQYNDDTNSKYTEYGVWYKRKKGTNVDMTINQAKALLTYISDSGNFWNIVQDSYINNNAECPGTGTSYANVRAYIMYIKDTFVIPDFRNKLQGQLMPTRTVEQWVLGHWDQVNKMVLDPGDPRQHSALLRDNDFAHISDEDYVAPVPVVDPDNPDAEPEGVSLMCQTSSDRPGVIRDAMNNANILWDHCEYDASTSIWAKKTDTYKSGLLEVREKGELLKVNGLEYLTADAYGKDLYFNKGGHTLLGDYSASEGLLDGQTWPALQLNTCNSKCKVAVYHHDTMMPIIWKVDKLIKDVEKIKGQRSAQLILDEDYLSPILYSSSYHDDYTFIDPAYPGLLDISKSRGTRVFLSKPHFYFDEHKDLQDKYEIRISGLSPRESKHNSRVWVEEVTGHVVKRDVKLQYNILLPPKEGVFGELDGSGMEAAGNEPLVYPMYWLQQTSMMTETASSELDTHPIYALLWIQYTLIPMSIICTMAMIAGGVMCIRRGTFMITHPSMRVNEAGMRYHQWMHDLHLARNKDKDKRRAEKQKRKELEKRIKSVMVNQKSTVGFEAKKNHGDHFNGTTSPFHNKL